MDKAKIVLYHLIEPVLVAILIASAMQISELSTIVYLTISITVLLPMLLTNDLSKVKVKQGFTIGVACYALATLLMKFWVFYQFTDTKNLDSETKEFLGIFDSQFVKTFAIDIQECIFASLLAITYTNHQKQLILRATLQGTKRYQTKLKYLHHIFGEQSEHFYTVSFGLYILSTLVFQTAIQLTVSALQLGLLFFWSIAKRGSTQLRNICQRLMQSLTLLMLIVTFVFNFPHFLQPFIQTHTRLMQLIGLSGNEVKGFNWQMHTNFVVLSFASVMTEVYFRSLTKQMEAPRPAPRRGPSFAGGHEGSVVRRTQSLVNLQQAVDSESESLFEKFSQTFSFTKIQIVLWTLRAMMVFQVYMLYDYLSLLPLLWVLASTVFQRARVFARVTAYIFLPLMIAQYLFYFIVNIFGIVDWTAIPQPEFYKYGFYQLQIPPLQLGILFSVLALMAYYTRLVFLIEDEFNSNEIEYRRLDSLKMLQAHTLYQICYLFILYINYPLFLFLIASGFVYMDIYHVLMIVIFVWAALYPATFQRHVVWTLLYADLYVLLKYLYSLTITTQQTNPHSWSNIIGISSDYDPQSVSPVFFRYNFSFDQWILVLLTFTMYRRANIIGTDQTVIAETERKVLQELGRKFPTLRKVGRFMLIMVSQQLLCIGTFLFYTLTLVYIRRSVLNLVSLCIVFIALFEYLKSGIQALLKVWKVIMWYSAFVLLCEVMFQFFAITGVKQSFYSKLTLRMKAYVYWFGLYEFSEPIWVQFLPYMLMFLFAVVLQDFFRVRVKADTEPLILKNQMSPEEQDSLYFAMLMKRSYWHWRLKPVWFLIDAVAWYYDLLVAALVLVYGLYVQIGILWLLYIGFYVLKLWRMYAWHKQNPQLAEFKQAHGESYAISSYASRRQKLQQNEATFADDILRHDSFTQTQYEQQRLRISDSQLLEQTTEYSRRFHEFSVQLRYTFWKVEFVVMTLAILVMYLGVFISAVFPEKPLPTTEQVYLIPAQTTRDFLIFLTFWAGLFRGDQIQLSDNRAFMSDYYPFFIFLLVLAIERRALNWLEDRDGATEQACAQYEAISDLVKLNPSQPKPNSDQSILLIEEEKEMFESVPRLTTSVSSQKQQQELLAKLKPYLQIKDKLLLWEALNTLSMQCVIMLVWFSCIYKQNIMSFVLFTVLLFRTYWKRFASVTVAAVIAVFVVQYATAILCLSSYNSPTQFPSSLLVNGGGVYPSAEHSYLAIPVYFKLSEVLKNTQTVVIQWQNFWGFFVGFAQLNGVWIDFAAMVLVCLQMNKFSFWPLKTPIKVYTSDQTKELLTEYACDPLTDINELKKELSRDKMFLCRFTRAMQGIVYINFQLVMIMFILFISIFSKSLLSFGYFIFCMVLIYHTRRFFVIPESAQRQLTILKWLTPYLLIDILLELIYNVPLRTDTIISTNFQNFLQNLGFIKVWSVTPATVTFGETGVDIVQQMNKNVSSLYLKGFTYFMIAIQILILRSLSFRKFNDRILCDNQRNSKLIGTGIAYRQNNFKNKEVLRQANDYSDLESMLVHVKTMIKRRDESPSSDSLQSQTPSQQLQQSEQQRKVAEIKEIYKTKLKSLSLARRFYLYLRRNHVQDILFKQSNEHLHDIVEQFRLGRTSIRSQLEISLLHESQQEWQQQHPSNIPPSQLEKPWEKVASDQMTGNKLFTGYVSLAWKLIASHTQLICYLFMLLAAVVNGGALYMVYPFMIFGYAAMEESRPGKMFWYFIIIYTQVIIFLQFFVQLNFFNFKDETTFESRVFIWLQQHNVGLIHIPQESFSFGTVLSTFYNEILILAFVLIHVQQETLCGIFDKKHEDYETFEEGLYRYIKVVLPADSPVFQYYEKEAPLTFDELHPVRKRRNSAPDLLYTPTEDILDQDSEILVLGLEIDLRQIKEQNLSALETYDLKEQVTRQKLTMVQRFVGQVREKSRILYDNSYFDRLFPLIRQQKPGEDRFVWITAVAVIMIIYVFTLYSQMALQRSTLAEQITTNQLQTPMVVSVMVILTLMVCDRVIFTIHQSISNILIDQKLDIRSPLHEQSPSEEQRPESQIIDQHYNLNRSEQHQSSSLGLGSPVTQQAADPNHTAFCMSLIPQYQAKTVQRVIKFYYIWFLVLLTHWYVFFYFPRQNLCPETDPYCNRVNENVALLIFYILCCVYLGLQAYQVKVGLPELKQSFMIGDHNQVSKTFFLIFYYIPFLFELRTIIDWTFSRTALDVFQSIKLAQVQSDLYLAKCRNQGYMAQELGLKQPLYMKAGVGGFLMLFVLGLIFVPLLLFSGLNPVAVQNPVTQGSLCFNLVIRNNTQSIQIPLFLTTQVLQLRYLTSEEFTSMGFSQSPETNLFTPSQVQALEFSPISDTLWQVPPPKVDFLLNALTYSLTNTDPLISVTAQLAIEMMREEMNTPIARSQTSLLLNNQTADITTNLTQMILCNDAYSEANFPTGSINLLNWLYTGKDAQYIKSPQVTSGARLSYHCSNTSSTAGESTSNYWSLNQIWPQQNPYLSIETEIFPVIHNAGFGFFIFNQTVLPSALADYASSILIFYATVVYIIATTFRSAFVPRSNEIFVIDSVNTIDLLMVCQCIYIYRVQRNTKNEEELYFILIDIMRSPETLKKITGPSLKRKLD